MVGFSSRMRQQVGLDVSVSTLRLTDATTRESRTSKFRPRTAVAVTALSQKTATMNSGKGTMNQTELIESNHQRLRQAMTTR